MKNKKLPFPISGPTAGFTLVEVLLATSIISIILLFAGQMVSSTSLSVNGSRKIMDADNLARMVFDRMNIDLSKISQGSTTDIYFNKKEGNDKMYFFSEAPASFEPETTGKNTISLIGYQINTEYETSPHRAGLMRLGKGLSWDSAGSSTTAPMICLTFPAGSFEPDPRSTIAGNNQAGAWVGALNDNSTDPDQHLLGAQVFRFEYYFLLKDGSFSTIPAKKTTSPKSNLESTSPPSPSNDNQSDFGAGSRWWDQSEARGYICTQATSGLAVWKPLGLDDVSAIVVNLAILDKGSTEMVGDMGQLSQVFGDTEESSLRVDPPKLLMEVWNDQLTAIIASPPEGIPKILSGKIQLYQRIFNINQSH